MLGRLTMSASLALALASCSKTNPCDDDIGAFVMAQEFIKQKLKAPSTADFPSIVDSGVSVSKTSSGGKCAFRVRTPVDAENSFGAKLREHFTVELKPDGEDGQTWSLISINEG